MPLTKENWTTPALEVFALTTSGTTRVYIHMDGHLVLGSYKLGPTFNKTYMENERNGTFYFSSKPQISFWLYFSYFSEYWPSSSTYEVGSVLPKGQVLAKKIDFLAVHLIASDLKSLIAPTFGGCI